METEGLFEKAARQRREYDENKGYYTEILAALDEVIEGSFVLTDTKIKGTLTVVYSGKLLKLKELIEKAGGVE